MINYPNSVCTWCGKSFYREKSDIRFCFCEETCREQYDAWKEQHEAKIAAGEFGTGHKQPMRSSARDY